MFKESEQAVINFAIQYRHANFRWPAVRYNQRYTTLTFDLYVSATVRTVLKVLCFRVVRPPVRLCVLVNVIFDKVLSQFRQIYSLAAVCNNDEMIRFGVKGQRLRYDQTK